MGPCRHHHRCRHRVPRGWARRGPGDEVVEVALRGRDGLSAAGEVFLGGGRSSSSNPVLTEITLPNGTWQLGAVPRGGWPDPVALQPQSAHSGGSLAAACGFGAWRLVRDPVRLRSEVAAARESVLVSERRQSLLVVSVEDYAIFMLAPDGTVASWETAPAASSATRRKRS